MAKTKRQSSITESSISYGKKEDTRKVDDQDGATTARKEEFPYKKQDGKNTEPKVVFVHNTSRKTEKWEGQQKISAQKIQLQERGE